MNKNTIKKMKDATRKESDRIKKLACFQDVSNSFSLEYTLAEELQNARKDVDLTQKDLAERMGTTQSVISRIEHGYNVSLNTIEKYAQTCGKHIELHVV